MKTLCLALFMLGLMVPSSWGQTKKPRTLDELVAYTGADRHQILLEGAKAEGKLSGIPHCPRSIVKWSTPLKENIQMSRSKCTAVAAPISDRVCSMRPKRDDM